MTPQRTVRPLAIGLVVCSLAVAESAHGGRNDLELGNLCPQGYSATLGMQECRWIERDAGGRITGVNIDSEGRSNFRALMSELGVVLAPRIPMTADTLGFAGFSLSGELGFSRISRAKTFWNGVNAVSPQSPNTARPDSVLSTVGLFLRKGIWFPAPSLELGGGVVHLLDSQLLSWQGYAKFALHEGFHDLPFPSLAARAAVSYLTGTDQVSLTTTSMDILVSKGFGVLKTLRVEPFGGWSLLLIKAAGKPIDFTPLCDANAAEQASVGQAVPGCAVGQSGTRNDFRANVAFPAQEVITRYRVVGGAKLKFGTLAVIAQYELYFAGNSRDQNDIPAVDQSGRQDALSLSTGLEF